MARDKLSDLAKFQEWLTDDCGLTGRSATVYASRVRAILKRCPTITTESLAEALNELGGTASYIACWNRFADFCWVKGVGVPKLTKNRRVHKNTISYLPEAETEALLKVIQSAYLKRKVLPRLQWGDIRMSTGTSWEIADPDQRGVFYTAPAEEMRILCDWANGIEDVIDCRPFIPARPMGMKPMPLAVIRRSLAGHNSNPDH